jgi:hypothetical protein
VAYTITASTFSQDVIFTGPVDPADYGFPRNTTRIQIITEFYGAPEPDELRRPLFVEGNEKIRARMASPDLIDEQLGFGRFVLTTGTAFVDSTAESTNGLTTLVAKEYKTINGRTYLFESVPFSAIATALTNLPPCQSSLGGSIRQPVKGYAGIPHLGNKPSSAPVMVQASRSSVHGVVVDYVANIGGTMSGTIVFKGDTTYLVSSAVSCNGPTIIEGGAVFKYKSGASMSLNSTLTCKTGMYRPAIFTAVDDDTVGDTMNGVSGSGYTGTISLSGYANPALYSQSAMNFTGLRFRYAQEAIRLFGNSYPTWTAAHSQFVNCIVGINLEIGGGGSGSGSGGSGSAVNYLNLYNCLFTKVGKPIISTQLGGLMYQSVNAYNATVDQSSQLVTFASGSGYNFSLLAKNSIFANISWGVGSGVSASGANNAFYNAGSTFGSPEYTLPSLPFQSVGAGNYYLNSTSGLQDSGTTNGLPATLFSDLQKRTTYPPWVMAGTTLVTNLVLLPQAWRDTNTPDLGYHYDPIDYAFGNVYVTNASVTASGGTAIATFGTNNSAFGLGFGSGASLNSVGMPNYPDWIVLFNTVQEGTNTAWKRLTNSVSGELYGATPAPSIFTRFTSWSVLAQDSVQFYAPTNTGPIAFQDSEFHGGKIITYRPTIDLTNCLLERVYADLSSKDSGSPYIRNSLFVGGTFNFAPNVSTALVKDNLFDQTLIPNNSSVYTTYNGGYNGFVTSYNRLLPTNAADVVLAYSPQNLTGLLGYQTGPLGLYYLSQYNPGIYLINKGNATADQVGLYHYTVTTNMVSNLETKETNSVVDIGYHYVALDVNGNPIDTDGDGLPDYLEDSNGNGISDTGDFGNWLINAFNGLNTTYGLQVFTPLK